MYCDLGTYVRERRQDLGLSQEQLAERVGGHYSQSDISRIERSHLELPRLATMVSLAAALEVPVGNLLIASGWFSDGHFASAPHISSDPVEGRLGAMLAEIEAELEAIRDLERQAESRAKRLGTMIRNLKVTSDVSVNQMAAD